MIGKYDRPLLFYSVSTIIPWLFWFMAGYVSHLTPYSDQNLRIASILGFIGLLAPLGVTWWLSSKDVDLRADILGRLSISMKYSPPIRTARSSRRYYYLFWPLCWSLKKRISFSNRLSENLHDDVE